MKVAGLVGSGGAGRSRTDLLGFAIRCITALLPRRLNFRRLPKRLDGAHGNETGAGNESRTRDLNLGKVALYQLSYSRVEAWHYSGNLPGYEKKFCIRASFNCIIFSAW